MAGRRSNSWQEFGLTGIPLVSFDRCYHVALHPIMLLSHDAVFMIKIEPWLRDRTGKVIARYDKSDDRTRDRSGRIVGNGDQRLRKLGDR